MGGSLLAAASAGDCRNVKGTCPALRPGRLCGAFRFRELVPCFGPRPAAFNSLRSCSFSPRRRSISLSACFNCSRKPRFSASYSFSCLRRSSCLEPSIAPYRDMKPPKCPAFSANQLPDVSSCRAFWRRGEGHRAGAEEGVEKGNRAQGWGTIPPRLGLCPTHQRKSRRKLLAGERRCRTPATRRGAAWNFPRNPFCCCSPGEVLGGRGPPGGGRGRGREGNSGPGRGDNFPSRP